MDSNDIIAAQISQELKTNSTPALLKQEVGEPQQQGELTTLMSSEFEFEERYPVDRSSLDQAFSMTQEVLADSFYEALDFAWQMDMDVAELLLEAARHALRAEAECSDPPSTHETPITFQAMAIAKVAGKMNERLDLK